MTELERQAHILLVEDDPDDIEFTRLALERTQTPNCLHVARDGEEALSFLQQKFPYQGVPRPNLILLDLGLPRMSGTEFLEALFEDAELRQIPLVVLSNGVRPEEVRECYSLGANTYLQKPVSFDETVKLIHHIEYYWLRVAILPEALDRF